MVMEKLRGLSNKIIEPIAKLFQNSRISPNIITVFGLLAMVGASVSTAVVGYFDLHPAYLNITIGFIFLSGFFDLLDGGVAKFTGQKTKFGGVLDSSCDRLSDAFFIMGLIFGNFLNPPSYVPFIGNSFTWGIILGFLGIMGAFMTSYIRSRAEIEGVKMAGVGWIERGERLSVFFIGTILEMWFHDLGYGVMFWIFLGLTILMHVTAMQRITHARKELKTIDAGASNASKAPAVP
ncbi:MAG: CDP-alcohol phosphatidyltransferase family protein [Candidatus Lokiarchaeota archaeon]|nr:CDP-alcohol phosphatidyltransferase family protein [Candidatus Lokiarchaeota archaeon]